MESPAHHVMLVGTVPFRDTAEVFGKVVEKIGPLMKRMPDGETGPRFYWITSQARVLARHPDFEPAGHDWDPDSGDVPEDGAPKYRLKPGVAPGDVEIPPLGYPEAARDSYAQFKRMKAEGAIPAGTRFQVSLPTPLAFIIGLIDPASQADVAPAFEARLRAELNGVLAEVPHDDLAIQWDTCLEIYLLEGLREPYFPDPFDGCIDRMVALGEAVPEPVELGYHFCYGDFRHQHAVEPRDMALMVEMTNALVGKLNRSLTWVHYPVPRDRDDDAYFAPMDGLKLSSGTEVYLGLVHFTDGVEGSARRAAVAARHWPTFGIATECGLGRRPRDTIEPLLDIHAELGRGGPAS
jgi:hypothetical protein